MKPWGITRRSLPGTLHRAAMGERSSVLDGRVERSLLRRTPSSLQCLSTRSSAPNDLHNRAMHRAYPTVSCPFAPTAIALLIGLTGAPLALAQSLSESACTDGARRQQSTAARVFVGREELDRMGDANVAEVLKRLVGVTLDGPSGRGGQPRLRGLGSGYTQILLNGERMPVGLGLEVFSPDRVECIEITWGPTPETGTQAMAGTINLVLRDEAGVRKRLDRTVHLRWGRDAGHDQGGAGFTQSEQLGPFSYQLGAHAQRSHTTDTSVRHTTETDTASGATTLDQLRTGTTETRRDSVHLGGRLAWRLGSDDALVLKPLLMGSRTRTGVVQTTDTRVGSGDVAASEQQTVATHHLARLDALWQTRLGSDTRLELQAGASSGRARGDGLRLDRGVPSQLVDAVPVDTVPGGTGADSVGGFGATDLLAPSASAQRARPLATPGLAAPLLSSTDDARFQQDDWLRTSGKISHALDAGRHRLAFGWDVERGLRDDERALLQRNADGTVTQLSGDLTDNLRVRSRREAFWLQNEWTVSPQWVLQPGLRWESLTTRSDTPDAAIDHRSRVLSPMLHALYRPVEGGPDQVRLALTRGWRAPTLAQLVARRTESASTNLASNPDLAGNPSLRPELATGLDLAFERHLPSGGVLSIGFFERRISDLIRTQTTQEALDGRLRWVARPQNIGSARTRGVALDAQAHWADLIGPGDAPQVALRGNLSVYRSRVENITGPDNRLDQQPDWSADLGADWQLREWPLTLGVNVAYTPGFAVQVDAQQRSTTDTRRAIDAYALWRLSPTLQMRLLVANWQPRNDAASLATTTAQSLQVATTRGQSSTAWSLRLELKL